MVMILKASIHLKKKNRHTKTAAYYTDYVARGECGGAPNVNLGFSRIQGPSQAAVNQSNFFVRGENVFISMDNVSNRFLFRNFSDIFYLSADK